MLQLTHLAPHQLQAVSLSNPMPRETALYFLMGMQLKKRNIHAKQYGLYAFVFFAASWYILLWYVLCWHINNWEITAKKIQSEKLRMAPHSQIAELFFNDL